MKVSEAGLSNEKKELPQVTLCCEVHGGCLGQVRFVPKVNVAPALCWYSCRDPDGGEAQEDSIGPIVAVGSCPIIRNMYVVSSSGSWHTAPKTLQFPEC